MAKKEKLSDVVRKQTAEKNRAIAEAQSMINPGMSKKPVKPMMKPKKKSSFFR